MLILSPFCLHLQDGTLLVMTSYKWSYYFQKWPKKTWVTGVRTPVSYIYHTWSYNPTDNWIRGPRCRTLLRPFFRSVCFGFPPTLVPKSRCYHRENQQNRNHQGQVGDFGVGLVQFLDFWIITDDQHTPGPHRIHLWYIDLSTSWWFLLVNVGKCTIHESYGIGIDS